MTSIIPAVKGAQIASKALTGDLYVRRWTTTKGKGKKKREVEHEAHVNPLTLAVGAAAAGVGALVLGGALWMTQRKLTKVTDAEGEAYKDMVLIIDTTKPVYKTVTESVLVRDAYTYTTYIRVPGFPEPIEKVIQVPAVYETVTKDVLVTAEKTTVKTKRGVPTKRFDGPLTAPEQALTQGQRSAKYFCLVDQDRVQSFDWGTRTWKTYRTYSRSSYQLGERDGFKVLIDV